MEEGYYGMFIYVLVLGMSWEYPKGGAGER